MEVSVRFFAGIRELVGKKVEFVNFPQDRKVTVEKIMQRLVKLYGKEFFEYAFDKTTGYIREYLTLLVNGRSITTLDGLETEILDGDVIALLPPVGGG